MQALMSYVSDLIVPFPHSLLSSTGNRKQSSSDNTSALLNASLHADAVKEAIALWTPLLGLNIPRWAEQAKDSRMAQQITKQLKDDQQHERPSHTAARSATSISQTSSLPSSTASLSNIYLSSTTPTPLNHSTTFTPSQQSLIHATSSIPQPDSAHQEQAREGTRAILISKQTLKKLLRQELLLQQQNKFQFRRYFSCPSHCPSSFSEHLSLGFWMIFPLVIQPSTQPLNMSQTYKGKFFRILINKGKRISLLFLHINLFFIAPFNFNQLPIPLDII
jgi:hypothetical protein